MNKCKEAQKDCKAYCCKAIGFTYPKGQINQEQREYFEMHKGVVVIERKDADYVVIKTPCKYLNDDLTCSIYEDRPNICKDGYSKLKDGVLFMPGCVYPYKKGSIIMLKDEMGRLEE